MTEVLEELNYFVDYPSGGNIKIGQCFQLHCKYGDGNITRVQKTESKHLSSDIQVKMDIRKYIRIADVVAFASDEIQPLK